MAFLTLEDQAGPFDGAVFDEFVLKDENLRPGAVVFLGGMIDPERDPPSIRVSDIVPIGKAPGRLSGSRFLKLVFYKGLVDRELSIQIAAALKSHPGDKNVVFGWSVKDAAIEPQYEQFRDRVTITHTLVKELRAILGERGSVEAVRQ